MKEDEKDVRLSDYFREKGSDLELTCHVINITYRKNRKFLDNCQPIREYSFFVNRSEQNQERGMSKDDAIRESIDYCIKHQIMQSFLERNRREVLIMMMLQWNAEEARKVQEAERLEDIHAAERNGEAKATATIIRNLLSSKSNASQRKMA